MKSNWFVLLFLILVFFSCQNQDNVKIINVNDYGIVAGTGQSITAKINGVIEQMTDEPTVIYFPKGRYNFYPDSGYMKEYHETNTYDINPKKLAVFINSKKDITIDGGGSLFVFHGHMQPFTVDHSKNIILKNINIDWDKPLTAESEVLEADSNHILVKIDTSQFPYIINKHELTFAAEGWEADWHLTGGSWLIEFDTNHIIPNHTGDHGCVNGDLNNVVYSDLEPGLVLMKGNFTKTPTVGNYLVMRHSTRDHAGIFLFHSKNLHLENINVYHTAGLGVLSQYSENITMKSVNVIPNPNKNRYLSGHDDGLHFMGCSGSIVIDRCRAQGLMDDAINIHGTYVPVAERIDDFTLKCNYAHDMSRGLIWAEVGDSVGFVFKKSMITTGYNVVTEFKMMGENSFVLKFRDKLLKELSTDYSLENLTCIPDVAITNCFAGSNRARGYLISTPGKVIIENNIFETSGSAILIAGDANYWYESGAVKDVTIRNNTFKVPCNSSSYQFCNAVISIYPEIPETDSLNPYHRNITIEHNTFNMFDYPLLYARSVDGLSFVDNTLKRSYDYQPWRPVHYNFYLDACRNVDVSNNTIDDDLLGKNIFLKNMSKDEVIRLDSAIWVTNR